MVDFILERFQRWIVRARRMVLEVENVGIEFVLCQFFLPVLFVETVYLILSDCNLILDLLDILGNVRYFLYDCGLFGVILR